MITSEQKTRSQTNATPTDGELLESILGNLQAYEWRYRRQRAEASRVSRYTLWRFLQRGHVGRSLPGEVLSAVGGGIEALAVATWCRHLGLGLTLRRARGRK